eukprot:m.455175 g.455175  ORF g.455175 m.455175 type:complete len:54 (-) comp20818_c0_seq1:122-283(-)
MQTWNSDGHSGKRRGGGWIRGNGAESDGILHGASAPHAQARLESVIHSCRVRG